MSGDSKPGDSKPVDAAPVDVAPSHRKLPRKKLTDLEETHIVTNSKQKAESTLKVLSQIVPSKGIGLDHTKGMFSGSQTLGNSLDKSFFGLSLKGLKPSFGLIKQHPDQSLNLDGERP
ncbi:hypothetical protein [Leptolyngbya sp. O-77]|uniref:hypothetical protein n=1 Tax=Leptolyngbya sp. O-77 TaxID=1080068 RepID=UPI001560BD94|nr:hypothetical protein [Leptolyngbya sp. O-77]